MKRTWYEMFGWFIGLSTALVNGSNHTNWVLLRKQKFMTQPTLIDLHSNEYGQKIRYYQFAVNLDQYVASGNALNDLSNIICIPNKAEDLNMSVFNTTISKNEWKTLTKHISCECKRRFDGK